MAVKTILNCILIQFNILFFSHVFFVIIITKKRGKGRKELDNLINQIKVFGIIYTNSDIFVVYKPKSPNPQIISLEPTNTIYNKLVIELNYILSNNMIQPQMLTDTKYYIPIYDDDFSYPSLFFKKFHSEYFKCYKLGQFVPN